MFVAIDRRTYSLISMPPRPSGQRFRELRDKKRWSLRDAARRTGLAHGTIQQLEDRIGRWDKVQLSTLEAISRGYGVRYELIKAIAEDRDDPEEAQTNGAAEALEAYRVHPDWLVFPVYGSVSAGDEVPEPLSGEIAFVPRDHLARRGAREESVRVYMVNGACMVSDEARRLEKNFAPGDYVAVDLEKGYEVGDTVVAWWPEESLMVIKRYKVEGENIVLFPIASGRPQVVLPSEDQVNILGPVVWRGG
jgi:transcriptional regulator with XRE-family HTH domain